MMALTSKTPTAYCPTSGYWFARTGISARSWAPVIWLYLNAIWRGWALPRRLRPPCSTSRDGTGATNMQSAAISAAVEVHGVIGRFSLRGYDASSFGTGAPFSMWSPNRKSAGGAERKFVFQVTRGPAVVGLSDYPYRFSHSTASARLATAGRGACQACSAHLTLLK